MRELVFALRLSESTDIYAKTEDGDYTAKCTVTVTTWEKRKEDIPVVYTDCDMTVDEMVEEQMTACCKS